MIAQYHNFSVKLAQKCGVDNAVFLQDIAYWMDYNRSSETNFRDGRYWVYNTLDAICERHPYWSKHQVRRIIDNCKKNGWLIIGEYNENRYNHTTWYSISDEIVYTITGTSKCQDGHIEETESTHRSAETGTSYNDIINKENNIKDIYCSKKTMASYEPEWFERFWSKYPPRQGKRSGRINAIKEWDKLKPSIELCAIMSEAIEKECISESWIQENGKYIPLASTWLHQRRWEDNMEVEENRKPKKPKMTAEEFDRLWEEQYGSKRTEESNN